MNKITRWETATKVRKNRLHRGHPGGKSAAKNIDDYLNYRKVRSDMNRKKTAHTIYKIDQ